MTVMTEAVRDWTAGMHEAIDAAIPDGDYVAPVVAASLVERLRREDPELLAGWLDVRAAVFLSDVIAQRSNSRRQTLRHHAPRLAFAQAAQTYAATGDSTELSAFTVEFVIDADHTRRRVGRMVADDCRFVAARYEDSARAAKLEASFWKQVARKIGTRAVGEEFDEEQFLTMYRSITGREQGPRDTTGA